MNTFITVFFWVGLAGVILRMITIAITTYPHQKTETLGLHLMQLLESIFFVVWAAILIWWK